MDPVVLLEIHSGLRWLLIAVTVIALIVTLRSFRGGAGVLNRIAMLLFRIRDHPAVAGGAVFLLVVKYPMSEWSGTVSSTFCNDDGGDGPDAHFRRAPQCAPARQPDSHRGGAGAGGLLDFASAAGLALQPGRLRGRLNNSSDQYRGRVQQPEQGRPLPGRAACVRRPAGRASKFAARSRVRVTDFSTVRDIDCR